jgi:dihydrofolate reductase
MGRSTFLTFPGPRALPNRVNIVLTTDKEWNAPDVTVCHSVGELFEELKKYDTNDVFIIGGASVYKQLLPYCDTAYVTKFDKSYEKDASIPDLDQDAAWKMEWRSEDQISNPETDTEAGLVYYFTKYVKVV